MIYGSFITGFILIITGLIVKNNPDLLAGYNTLSQEEKQKIDSDKLTRIARNYLVSTGISVLLIECILSIFTISKKTHLYVIFSVIIIGISLLIIQSNRLKLKNKNEG